MKIWRISVETELYFVTEDDKPPTSWQLEQAARDEVSLNGADIHVVDEVKDEKDIYSPWDAECLPYGKCRDLTMKQILSGQTSPQSN